jgi:hypothetical protein
VPLSVAFSPDGASSPPLAPTRRSDSGGYAPTGSSGRRCAALDSRPALFTTANPISWSERALPIVKQEVGKFKQLKPPKADEAGWKAYGAEGDKTIVWFGKLRDEAKRNDRAALIRLADYRQKQATRESSTTQKLGLAECG